VVMFCSCCVSCCDHVVYSCCVWFMLCEFMLCNVVIMLCSCCVHVVFVVVGLCCCVVMLCVHFV